MGRKQDRAAYDVPLAYEGLARTFRLGNALRVRSDEQISPRLRRMLNLITELPDALAASFATNSPDERCDQLMKKMAEIDIEIDPVFDWIRHNRSHEAAKSLKDRLWQIFVEVLECASCDIPEYAEGAPQREPMDDPSDGWRRTFGLGSTVIRYVAELHVLANAIDLKVVPATADRTQPQRSLTVDVEAGVVHIDGRAVALNGTKPVKKRLAEFINDLIDADGEYVKTPDKLKTPTIEDQPVEVRDLIEAQPGAGRRIPRKRIWRS